MNRSALHRVLSGPVLLVALLAGCATPDRAAPEPAASPSTAAQGDHGGHGDHGGGQGGHADHGAALWAVQTGPLGVVVTNGSGQLMYRSDADSADPPTSNCTGPCTETWIPVTVDPDQQPDLAGIDDALLGRLQRADGSIQLTLAGWPLYHHRDDDGTLTSTGQHGAEGTWFVVTPSGEKATPA